ncbi:MAG TPA: DNA-directed RNA polymerase subunit D [Euryarchaeota archaeon]|nr:DNA-directed RNA polymerase subunit D [Euryarchaeota archaeon]HIQ10027.1 DNA-directed RNA polymerase subunit D [Euryarchaeota archaeon]
MKVEILERDKDSITFLLKGVPLSLANALRRAVISEVPVFAIEDVYFYENNTSIWDEYIAHRLGLVPLKAEWGTYNRDSEVKFYLDKQGPGVVYSGDLQPETPGVEVVDPEIPIVVLREDQALRLEAVAKVGDAREHAKWQAGIASFRPVVRVEIKDEQLFRELLPDIDPEDVRRQNERPQGVDTAVYNLVDEVLEDHPEVGEIKKKKDVFLFYVESYGNLPVDVLVRAAVSELLQRLEMFMTKVEGNKA